jgi:hypothetical protein
MSLIMCQWIYVNDYAPTDLCPLLCVNDSESVTSFHWLCANGFMSMVMLHDFMSSVKKSYQLLRANDVTSKMTQCQLLHVKNDIVSVNLWQPDLTSMISTPKFQCQCPVLMMLANICYIETAVTIETHTQK